VTPLGTGGRCVIIATRCQRSTEASSIRKEGMADPKGGKPSATTDGAGIHVKNAISMTMEDLSEDRKEIEHEIESEMTERRNMKLACFQKT
jgi:hypothetical protein